MGFMDKLKNMFTEEIEIEDPIKKDVIQVEIPSPVKEEVKEIKKEEKKEVENIIINDSIKKVEEKKNTPVFFDDDDFKILESPVSKKEEKKEEKKEIVIKPYATKIEKKEEKKVFKPTPIISPVYGVLDKNYRKEDITDRKDHNTNYYSNKEDVSIDDIRAKAYGTLEDDLENSMYDDEPLFFEEEKTVSDVLETEEIVYKKEKKLPSRLDRKKEELDNMVEEEMNNDYKSEDSINDSDLFDLIDSMYDKGDE